MDCELRKRQITLASSRINLYRFVNNFQRFVKEKNLESQVQEWPFGNNLMKATLAELLSLCKPNPYHSLNEVEPNWPCFPFLTFRIMPGACGRTKR